MPLPDINAITTIKVEVDDSLVGLYPFTESPVITSPADNEVIKIDWDDNPEIVWMVFDWDIMAGVAAYELEISDQTDFPPLHTLFFSDIAAFTYSIKAYRFPLDRNLYVRVRGIDGYKVSPWSEVIQFSLTREKLQEEVEQVNVKKNVAEYEKQYFLGIQSGTDKKRATVPGPMKLHLDNDDSPPDWIKNGMVWYDETVV